MSGKRCPRCKSYVRDHAPDGTCVDPHPECIAQWEAAKLKHAEESLRFMNQDYLKTRWSEAQAEHAESLPHAHTCKECDWPPPVGSMATRYQCGACTAVIYLPPENS